MGFTGSDNNIIHANKIVVGKLGTQELGIYLPGGCAAHAGGRGWPAQETL